MSTVISLITDCSSIGHDLNVAHQSGSVASVTLFHYFDRAWASFEYFLTRLVMGVPEIITILYFASILLTFHARDFIIFLKDASFWALQNPCKYLLQMTTVCVGIRYKRLVQLLQLSSTTDSLIRFTPGQSSVIGFCGSQRKTRDYSDPNSVNIPLSKNNVILYFQSKTFSRTDARIDKRKR